MILEEYTNYIKLTLNEQDVKRGIIDLLEENIPTFGVMRSNDDREWYVSESYRSRLTGLIHKLNSSRQLSLFSV